MAQQAGRTPPRYRQVAADLRARIEGGEYPAGALLPTKPELAERYGVSPGTLDHAIAELRALGFVETAQGVGMYARKPPAEHSEYDAVMGRVDALAEEVRLLQDRMTAVEQAQAAESG